MRWFRSHVRLGARLALFALAVQLAVSFGHVHAEDFAPSAAAVTLTASGGQGGPVSDGTSHKSDIDTVCAICALIQLVQASVPVAAPAVHAPTRFAWITPKPPVEAAAAALQHELFQARAPPSA
jgi:hypothetical protein